MVDGGEVIDAAGFLVRRADANWEGQGGRTTLRSKRFEHDNQSARWLTLCKIVGSFAVMVVTRLRKINDTDVKSGDRHSGGRRRGPRKATPKRLERAALHYLERYASSSENLRRVLMRRVERSARKYGTDREEGATAVDEIVRKFTELGYLNDKAYAEMRVAGLHRRGTSGRAIRYRLTLKGVPEDDIEAALEALAEDVVDPDRSAAIAYARRRRIGPWRRDNRDRFRDRDLAALGRQGFSFDVALWIVDAESSDACEINLSDD